MAEKQDLSLYIGSVLLMLSPTLQKSGNKKCAKIAALQETVTQAIETTYYVNYVAKSEVLHNLVAICLGI